MEKLSICRICLDNNTQHVVVEPQLQDLYQRLTAIPFQTSDMRPVALCYICHAQLSTSHGFMLKCLKAEELLQETIRRIINGHVDQKPPINRLALNNMIITKVETLSIDCTVDNFNIEIKSEIPIVYENDAGIEQKSTQAANIKKKPKLNPEISKSAKGVKTLNIDVNIVPTEASTPESNVTIVQENNSCNSTKQSNYIEDIIRSGRRRYVCNFCMKVCNEKGTLIRHIRTHTGERPYACNVCHKSFNIKNHLIVHARLHTGERPYVCEVCNKSFHEQSNLIRHKRVHTGERRHACNVCDKKFGEKSTLRIHLRSHTGEKPYECNVCNRCFTVKSALNSHARTHTGIKPHVCETCQKRFYTKRELINHVRTHNGEKPYVCKVCKHSYTDKSSLVSHSRIHANDRPFVCDTCNKSFKRKTGLRNHIITHTAKKAHVCNVCKQRFAVKQHLKVHARIHSSERPYMCKVCYKCFGMRSHLTRHARVHSYKKNTSTYHCVECDKVFLLRSEFNKHIILHDTERHFCDICNRFLKTRGQLIRHYRSHANTEPYACTFCKKTFKMLSSLVKHTRLKHTENKANVCDIPRVTAAPVPSADENRSFPFDKALMCTSAPIKMEPVSDNEIETSLG